MTESVCVSPERKPVPGPLQAWPQMKARHFKTPEKPQLSPTPATAEAVPPEHAVGKRIADSSPPGSFRRIRKLLTVYPQLDLEPLDRSAARSPSPAPERSLLGPPEPESDSQASILGALEAQRSDEGDSRPCTPPSPFRDSFHPIVPPSPARVPLEAMRRRPNATIRLDLGRSARRQNLQERHLRLLAEEMIVA